MSESKSADVYLYCHTLVVATRRSYADSNHVVVIPYIQLQVENTDEGKKLVKAWDRNDRMHIFLVDDVHYYVS